jgi:hypothetical protein
MMKNSVILSIVAMLALGVVAARTTRTAVATIEPQVLAATISPFDMMQNARGLRVDAYSNAI